MEVSCDAISEQVCTTLSAGANAGDTVIHVNFQDGFNIGDVILIGNDANMISGFGSMLLARPLINDLPAGTVVKQVWPATPQTAMTVEADNDCEDILSRLLSMGIIAMALCACFGCLFGVCVMLLARFIRRKVATEDDKEEKQISLSCQTEPFPDLQGEVTRLEAELNQVNVSFSAVSVELKVARHDSYELKQVFTKDRMELFAQLAMLQKDNAKLEVLLEEHMRKVEDTSPRPPDTSIDKFVQTESFDLEPSPESCELADMPKAISDLLVGTLLQALPGMQYVSSDGVEYFRSGDVGTAMGSEGEALRVLWARTGRTSSVPESNWVWFRFFCARAPHAGDFLLVLPGMAETDRAGAEIYTEGDIGQAESVDFFDGEANSSRVCSLGSARVWWPRTRRSSIVPQHSWLWFRIIRARDGERSQLDEAVVDRMYCDALPHVFFTRCARLLLEDAPQVGDLVQVAVRNSQLPAEGDVGTVVSIKSRGACAVVAWHSRAVTSTLLNTSWESLRFIRLPAPRVGDLFRTMSGAHTLSDEALVVDGVVGGDVSWVTSFEMNAAHEACVGVLWARTGRASLYTMASWPSRFNLIPLERPELTDQISIRDANNSSATTAMVPQLEPTTVPHMQHPREPATLQHPRHMRDLILNC
jgi:hypothetical protein